MLLSDADPGFYSSEGLLVEDHADGLLSRLSGLCLLSVILLLGRDAWRFGHVLRAAAVEPLTPVQVGLIRLLLFQVPPPPLLQQFLHQNSIVALLDVSSKDCLAVAHRYLVGGVYQFAELIPNASQIFNSVLFADLLDGHQLLEGNFHRFAGCVPLDGNAFEPLPSPHLVDLRQSAPLDDCFVSFAHFPPQFVTLLPHG